MTDIEIANSIKKANIIDIAKKIGIEDYIELYGSDKAKIKYNEIDKNKNGKLILVTSINPTPYGEGKTTVSIGLNDGLRSLNYNSLAVLREPSLGPVFGIKGGATGGGYAQISPSVDINLHFTGDFHAITSANNLICSAIDNSIYQGNLLNIDPNKVNITCEGDAKNLLYIYIESLENTYASIEDGGMQPVNYIPKLTQLANENTSFSDTDLLGGAYITTGAGWTMGALFATTPGIPFSFPIESNSMDDMETFASGATALGDILNDLGYTQKFLCGSDGEFAGRKNYFEQHGNYEVLDYDYAIDEEYIPDDYFVWWGYEDSKLYDIQGSLGLRIQGSCV